jgi:UDP-N-acetylglucosamine 2-epimerase (non-hydrolysing)
LKPELLLVAGARPNFMKIAPIAKAIRDDGRLHGAIVHTGQHYDRNMSELFFEELKIPKPEVHLGVGSASHARQTAEIMVKMEEVLLDKRPSGVVVVGDVNSTVAASLVAVKLGIPVAHVEAGLRSFDRTMPEEINRLLTDQISEWLFVTERSGMENLAREGVDPAKVHFTGNVMIDTLLQCKERAETLDAARGIGLQPGEYGLLTLHRPANVDQAAKLVEVLEPIRELSRQIPIIFPVHPRTAKMLSAVGLGTEDGVRVVEPLGYLQFLGLMIDARLVLTDSGGIQEETTVLGVPCVTLRDNTERPVTVSEGTNRLGGTSAGRIRKAIGEALSSGRAPSPPELWDGRAAERIVQILAESLGN